MESILDTIKRLVGVCEDDNNFDTDIVVGINTAFGVLCQIGVGPEEGFAISDASSKWSDFITENNSKFEMVKTFVHLKTKLLFDPPLSSSVLSAMNETLNELEWRLAE